MIPYIRDILSGSTKPNIVTWITWTLLNSVATYAEFSAHEYRTAIFTFSAVIGTFTVVLIGFKYGHTKYTWFDVICQISALLGFLLWFLLNSPAAAVIAAVIIDFIGSIPTLRHSWKQPYEETMSTYAIAGIGGVLALLTFSSYTVTSLSYPIYIVIINIIFSLIIIYRSRFIMKKDKQFPLSKLCKD
ncbi:MAG: hypothetical protein NVSMB46_01910 [Candidatus Saccharimonadales bacterium]